MSEQPTTEAVSTQTETAPAEAARPDAPAPAEPAEKAAPAKAASAKATPAKATPTKATPAKATPTKAAPTKAAPPAPAKATPAKATPTKAAPTKAAPPAPAKAAAAAAPAPRKAKAARPAPRPAVKAARRAPASAKGVKPAVAAAPAGVALPFDPFTGSRQGVDSLRRMADAMQAAARETREGLAEAQAAAQTGVRDLNRQVLGFAQDRVNAGIAAMRDTMTAGTPAEAARIQAGFLQDATRAYLEQVRMLTGETARLAEESAAPLRTAVTASCTRLAETVGR